MHIYQWMYGFWMKFYNYTIEVIKISNNNLMIVIFTLKVILKKSNDCIINDLHCIINIIRSNDCIINVLTLNSMFFSKCTPSVASYCGGSKVFNLF